MSGIPKTTEPQWFARSTHMTQKSCYTQLWFITVKGHRLKSAKGNGAWSKAQDKSSRCPHTVSHTEVNLILPAAMCNNECQALPNKEAHLSLSVQCLMGVSHAVAM